MVLKLIFQQSAEERRLQLLQQLADRGASDAEVWVLDSPWKNVTINQVASALAAHARAEAESRRLRRQKTSVGQFETIKLIGKGAFGEVCAPNGAVEWCLNWWVQVRLCRDLKNGDLVALKVRDVVMALMSSAAFECVLRKQVCERLSM